MADHSSIVGGSTAKRVIACPGSVALCQRMPERPSSEYADRGTLLHDAIADHLGKDIPLVVLVGRTYEGIELTEDLIEEKILPALAALDEIDTSMRMELLIETEVSFGDLLPGVFGTADVLGRLGDTAIVLDWKFGDGVAVSAEENEQMLFYAAAALRTPKAADLFEGAKDIELIIVQPPSAPKRWKTTFERVRAFEDELVRAVNRATKPAARLHAGDHCRWCAAKPVCPLMTGAVERAAATKLKEIDGADLARNLELAELAEAWAKDVRALAFEKLTNMQDVPGWKLVPKRGIRKWADETKAMAALRKLGVKKAELMETTMLSPAQAEKVLKKYKLALPDGLAPSISSGDTLAREDDPRPASLQSLGQNLAKALSKL